MWCTGCINNTVSFLFFFFFFFVTALLKKLKQQSRDALEERRPQLTAALHEVHENEFLRVLCRLQWKPV